MNGMPSAAGSESKNVIAIDHDNEAGFLAVEEFLDDDARTGIAQLVAGQHVVDGGVRFIQAHGDDDALAGGQAIGLDDDRRTLLVNVGMRCGRLGKRCEFGSRDGVAGHEALGEILGGLELRGFPGRPEYLQAAGAEDIDHAGGERRLGADVFQLVLARRAGIAGGDIHLLQSGRLRQLPGHGVLAAAGTDNEEFH